MKNDRDGIVASILEFRPYFAMLKPVKYRYAAALLLGLVYGAASGFGFPFMAYKIFPFIFADQPPPFWQLAGAAALLPAVFIIRGLTGFGNAYLSASCGQTVLNRIKGDLFGKLQQLPLSFFSQHRVGDLLVRLKSDTSAVQMVVTVVSNDLIKQPITFIGAIGSLAYMAVQNEQLVFILFALGVIPLCTVPIRHVGKRLLARSHQLQKNAGNITTVLHENIIAAKEVRAFNLQARERARFADLLETLFRYSLKTVKYSQVLTPLIEVISAIGISVAVIYASSRGMSLAEVLPLMTALYMSYDPIKKLGGIQAHIKRGQASRERIEYILNATDSVPEPVEPTPFDPSATSIVFDQVGFRYGQEPVLRDVSLTVPAGSVVALVGPSGAGKSTLVNLLPRFYDVETGGIRIGRHDVRDYALHDLRQHISIVSQDTILFNDSIRNNIRLGRLDATDEEVEQAARQAFAHGFITSFEAGYDTPAGDRGLRLSGGQKQRIAIARAFLKNAPILILDEATSSLDSESEEMVHRALSELVRGKTVLIIAHRFSTIRTADFVVVMDQGRMRAAGPHAELYASDTLYRSLYDRQFIS